MEVTTAYPVYVDGKRVGSKSNDYLYPEGPEPTDKEKKDKAKSEGKIWDKISGSWRKMTEDEASRFNKLRASGAFSMLGQLLGLQTPPAGTGTGAGSGIGAGTGTPPPPPPTKISTTTWVLIGVGVLALGGLIYFATRDKKSLNKN